MSHVHKAAINSDGHFREFELAGQLAALDDPELHLWFQLDCVPGVKDIDILAYHEAVGIFVIEVKGVRLNDIEYITYDECVIRNRDERINPNVQARSAMFKLIDFLSPRVNGIRDIGITPSACWPIIERARWDESFDNHELTGDYARRMLFVEDFATGPQSFIKRLRAIKANPIALARVAPPFSHSPQLLKRILDALRPEARPQPTPSDLERLSKIEGRVAAEAIAEAPIGGATRMLYKGAPGTGKTFCLLQIGAAHAAAGKRALYVCYNKVLAADIRRILQFSPTLNATGRNLEAFDIYDLLSIYASKLNIEDYTHDEWAAEIVSDLSSKKSIRTYDTVLVDEAQDLTGWAFDFIELHTTPYSTLCVGNGVGQELYDSARSESSEGQHAKKGKAWIERFERDATVKILRRNFRNPEPIFKLAQVFYEGFGKDERLVTETLARFKAKKKLADQLELPDCERKGGSLPRLRPIDEARANKHEDFPALYIDERRSLNVDKYRALVESEIADLRSDQRPIDILVLAPGMPYIAWAREALKDLPHLDYTDPALRRTIADADTIRLCTYHSCRGIEAHKVIVLGVEELARVAERDPRAARNLGYVVLSRATIDLTITRRSPYKSTVLTFIETVLATIAGGR